MAQTYRYRESVSGSDLDCFWISLLGSSLVLGPCRKCLSHDFFAPSFDLGTIRPWINLFESKNTSWASLNFSFLRSVDCQKEWFRAIHPLKSILLQIRTQNCLGTLSGTLPRLLEPLNRAQVRASRGGPRTLFFNENTVNLQSFDDFQIFLFSLSNLYIEDSSLSLCLPKFLFRNVPSRYEGPMFLSKVVISLGTSFKNQIFPQPASTAWWNALLDWFLDASRPQTRPQGPSQGSTNGENTLLRAFAPFQASSSV